MRTLIGITGTTAVGKSEVAVQLAKILRTEIVSADSMQIYKGMDIGTAKLTHEQMQGVPHHMIDIVEPNENYSAFLYRQRAAEIIDKLNGTPIVVGGTGFYFESLVYPPQYGECNAARRDELLNIYEAQGVAELKKILLSIDAAAADVIDTNNYKRVIRAIEIAESGASRAKENRADPCYKLILFVLQRSRQSLYRQIELRVDNMIASGLVDEVRQLVTRYGICNTPAFEAIGYKEIIEYIQGKSTLAEAAERIKLNTRHYAKRQISYYKRMDVARYIDTDDKNLNEITGQILCFLNENALII